MFNVTYRIWITVVTLYIVVGTISFYFFFWEFGEPLGRIRLPVDRTADHRYERIVWRQFINVDFITNVYIILYRHAKSYKFNKLIVLRRNIFIFVKRLNGEPILTPFIVYTWDFFRQNPTRNGNANIYFT